MESQSLEQLFNERDPRAYRMIYDKFWSILLDTAYKRVRDISLAQDLVQDIFISFFLKKDSITIEGSLENYLKSALRYKILTSLRSEYIHENYLKTLSDKSLTSSEDPYTILQVKELEKKIQSAIQNLPERPKEVFTLSKLHRISQKNIAEELGISVSTVEKHMSKAKSLLEKQLGKKLFTTLLPFIFIFLKNP